MLVNKSKIYQMFISLFLIVFTSSASDFEEYSYDVQFEIIDQYNIHIKDEKIMIIVQSYIDSVEKKLENGSVDFNNIKKYENVIMAVDGFPVRYHCKRAKSLSVYMLSDTNDVKGKVNEEFLKQWNPMFNPLPGGKYKVKIPWLEKNPQKFTQKVSYNKIDFTQNETYFYTLDLETSLYDKPTLYLEKDSLPYSRDLFFTKKSKNKVEIHSPNKKIALTYIKWAWPIMGDAPRKNSREWSESIMLNLDEITDSTIVTYALYSPEIKRFGKLAVQKEGDNQLKYMLAFGDEEMNRYLSSFDWVGPEWLNKEIDKLRGPDYGVIQFTPIPEWNYPVKEYPSDKPHPLKS